MVEFVVFGGLDFNKMSILVRVKTKTFDRILDVDCGILHDLACNVSKKEWPVIFDISNNPHKHNIKHAILYILKEEPFEIESVLKGLDFLCLLEKHGSEIMRLFIEEERSGKKVTDIFKCCMNQSIVKKLISTVGWNYLMHFLWNGLRVDFEENLMFPLWKSNPLKCPEPKVDGDIGAPERDLKLVELILKQEYVNVSKISLNAAMTQTMHRTFFSKIFNLLSKFTTLKKLELKFGDKGMLLHSFSELPHLEELSLANLEWLPNDGDNSTIKILKLENCEVGCYHGGGCCGGRMESIKGVENLSILHCPEITCFHWCQRTLKILDVDEGCSLDSDALVNFRELTHLKSIGRFARPPMEKLTFLDVNLSEGACLDLSGAENLETLILTTLWRSVVCLPDFPQLRCLEIRNTCVKKCGNMPKLVTLKIRGYLCTLLPQFFGHPTLKRIVIIDSWGGDGRWVKPFLEHGILIEFTYE